MRRRMGDRERASYEKSNQWEVEFSVAFRIVIINRSVKYQL